MISWMRQSVEGDWFVKVVGLMGIAFVACFVGDIHYFRQTENLRWMVLASGELFWLIWALLTLHFPSPELNITKLYFSCAGLVWLIVGFGMS